MIMARTETYVLPNDENGRFMAKRYENDMRNAGMDVKRYETDNAIIKIEGSFVGDLPDEYIERLKEKSK